MVQLTALAIAVGLLGGENPASAHDHPQNQVASTHPVRDEIVVTGRRLNLVGQAISASEGRISGDEVLSRPLMRSGDLLEFVPGLVATQHSGSGKANQYFLRGFNLDHGTDFATFVDAMPVNMRTHGHGQGWTDLNFLIPEAIETIDYRKGTYYADVGDFSSAGSARFHVADRMPAGVAEITLGSYGYKRGVVVDSVPLGAGDLLFGGELQGFDGPWTDIAEDVRKRNALLKYSAPLGSGRAEVTFMGYGNSWNSPDQIPERAVEQGLITELGSLDTSLGGDSSRFSLSGGWAGAALGGTLRAEAYAISSSLDLFSNFTYLLDDPLKGDQFRQVDDRSVYGFAASQQWTFGPSRWRAGVEGRYDDIERVGLFRTRRRQPVATIREDSVKEASLGIFLINEFQLTKALRTYVGVRYDRFHFDVDALSLPENSGTVGAGKTSAKASIIYAPNDLIELSLNYGQGYHSNDARGTTIRVDPVTGEGARQVAPLVGSEGAEFGARLHATDRMHATLALWTLRLESELLFVGDAGNTEATRPSRRDGAEVGFYYFASEYLSGEIEASWTRSSFRDDDPAGDRISGSIPLVLTGGLTAKAGGGWIGALRLRYFGKYPLREDNEIRSQGSMLLNARLSRRWDRFTASADLFNLLNSRAHDVDYFYASRLPGEPTEGVEDNHYHVFQPRSVRLSLRYRI